MPVGSEQRSQVMVAPAGARAVSADGVDTAAMPIGRVEMITADMAGLQANEKLFPISFRPFDTPTRKF